MSRTAQDVRVWILAGASFAFVVVCVLSLRNPQVVVFPSDSEMFRSVAVRGLADGDFWFGVRPWGFPLLMKLCGLDNVRLVTVQFGLHLASWLFFAAALFVAGRRSWLALAASVAVLVFACSPHLVSWSAVVLSESLAHSLLALLLGALLLFRRALADMEGAVRGSTWTLGAGVAASGALLAATRDNWPYLIVLVAVLLLVPPGRPGSARIRAAVAGVLIAACLFQVVSAKIGRRWREGMINVIFSRVVPHEEIRERWRVRYGLPVDEDMLRLGAEFEPGYQRDANLHESFQRWLPDRAVGSYARDIASHPVETTRRVLAGHRVTRDEFSWEYSNEQADGTIVARAVRAVLFRPLLLPPGLDFLFPILLLLWLARAGPATFRGPATVLLLLALYLPPLSALGYLSDSNEIYRHALPVAIGLRLLSLLATIGAVGAVIELVRRPRA